MKRQDDSDIRIGLLDPILEKLEKKGPYLEIAKYELMRNLRTKR